MVSPVASTRLIDSGAALFQSANASAVNAAALLSNGSPDFILDGILALDQASDQAKLGSILVRTSDELDKALLDIFA